MRERAGPRALEAADAAHELIIVIVAVTATHRLDVSASFMSGFPVE